jgi:hypothetical protein
MVYSTEVIPSYELAEEASRKLDDLLAAMARTRSKILRQEARRNPAHLGPIAAERSYGDIVIVMVDSGTGEQVREEIIEQLKISHHDELLQSSHADTDGA